jgi:hypothetical protein
MRIFERLPGRAYAAQQQGKRFAGVVAGMAPHRDAPPALERAPVAAQGDDRACSSAEAQPQDA